MFGNFLQKYESGELFPISDFKLCKGLAALLRSACFFAGALFFARMTLFRIVLHCFQIGFKLCKGVYCVDIGESFHMSI